MPFVCEQYAPASAAALLAEIEVMLVAAGWVLHDPHTATDRIYKSNGELGDRIYEYIDLSLAGAIITCTPYGWWNNGTHTGNCKSFNGSSITYAAGEKRIIGGDKNLFYVYKAATFMMFGHIPNRIDVKPLATLTAPAVAGGPVNLSVDNTDMFVPNMTYQLFGPTGEGRYPVKVTAAGGGVITILNLPVNMAAGAKIGACPSTFGYSKDSNAWIPTMLYNTSGTGDCASTGTFVPMIPLTELDPDARLGTGAGTTGLYVLQPIYFDDPSNPVGYCSVNILLSPVSADQTLYGNVNNSNGGPLDTGTATAGANFTLTCLGKLWGINAYQNKIVAIMSGAGAGQTRKIASNTADTLTVGVQWDTNPDITSIFAMFDEIYREVSAGGSQFPAFKEIINT